MFNINFDDIARQTAQRSVSNYNSVWRPSLPAPLSCNAVPLQPLQPLQPHLHEEEPSPLLGAVGGGELHGNLDLDLDGALDEPIGDLGHIELDLDLGAPEPSGLSLSMDLPRDTPSPTIAFDREEPALRISAEDDQSEDENEDAPVVRIGEEKEDDCEYDTKEICLHDTNTYGMRFPGITLESSERGVDEPVIIEVYKDVATAMSCLPPTISAKFDAYRTQDKKAPRSHEMRFVNACSELDLGLLAGYAPWYLIRDATGNELTKQLTSPILAHTYRTKDMTCGHHGAGGRVSDFAFFYLHAYVPSFCMVGKKNKKRFFEQSPYHARSMWTQIVHDHRRVVKSKCANVSDDTTHRFVPVFRMISRVEQMMEMMSRVKKRLASRVLSEDEINAMATGEEGDNAFAVSYLLKQVLTMSDVFRIFPLTPGSSKYVRPLGRFKGTLCMRTQFEDEHYLHGNIVPERFREEFKDEDWSKYNTDKEKVAARVLGGAISFREHLARIHERLFTRKDIEEKRNCPTNLYLVQDLYDAYKQFTKNLSEEDLRALPFTMQPGEQVDFFGQRCSGDPIDEVVCDYVITFRERVVNMDLDAERAVLEKAYRKGTLANQRDKMAFQRGRCDKCRNGQHCGKHSDNAYAPVTHVSPKRKRAGEVAQSGSKRARVAV